MEPQLIHTALAISVIGLLLLAYAGESLQPPVCRIKQITGNDLGRNVRFIGNITRSHSFKGGSMILTVNDSSGGIDVYVPYDVAAVRIDLRNATELEVTGSVEVYRGKLEIAVAGASSLRVRR